MGLTLKELEAAMAPLASVGKGELDFEVMGTRVYLRCLTPEEEIDVQRTARSGITEGDYTDQVGALEYLDKFRKSSLSYSIVQIGTLDFRNEEYIETGKTLPNGQKVKIRRHEAIQGLVSKWSRPMQIAVYEKFGEVMDKAEKEAEGLIEINPIDHDAEITRLEERVRELKEEKARLTASNADSRTAVRRQVASMKKTRVRPQVSSAVSEEEQQTTNVEAESLVVPSDFEREIVDETESEVEEASLEPEEVPPEPEPVPSGPRQPVWQRASGPMPPPAPIPPGAPTPPSSAGTPTPSKVVPTSSFVDPNDPDAMAEALESENQKILDMRRGRIPPHLVAKSVGESFVKELAVEEAPKVVSSKPELSGMLGGKEVYKLPEQVMTDRGRTSPAPVVVPENPPPIAKNVNPRFRPTTRK